MSKFTQFLKSEQSKAFNWQENYCLGFVVRGIHAQTGVWLADLSAMQYEDERKAYREYLKQMKLHGDHTLIDIVSRFLCPAKTAPRQGGVVGTRKFQTKFGVTLGFVSAGRGFYMGKEGIVSCPLIEGDCFWSIDGPCHA